MRHDGKAQPVAAGPVPQLLNRPLPSSSKVKIQPFDNRGSLQAIAQDFVIKSDRRQGEQCRSGVEDHHRIEPNAEECLNPLPHDHQRGRRPVRPQECPWVRVEGDGDCWQPERLGQFP